MIASALERRWRGRISALLFAGAALIFGVVYAIGHAERAAAFELSLADDLRTISNITHVYVDGDIYVNIEPEALGMYLAGGDRIFQVWDAETGELLDHSESLDTMGAQLPRPMPVLQMNAAPRAGTARLPDGRVMRLLSQRIRANWGLDPETLERTGQQITEHEVEVMIGRPESGLTASLLPLGGACLLGALAMPIFGILALRLGTRRFDALVHRLVLQRERERGFLAHAAHELRTPLAELRALVDLAELEAEAGAPVQPVLGDMRAVADRMGGLLSALFRLARVQRGHEEAAQPLDLVALADAALRAQDSAARQRGLQWERACPDRLPLSAPPTLLRALLDNLVGNAIAHARAGSRLQLAIEPGTPWSLCIANQRDPATPPQPAPDHLGQGLLIAQLYAQATGLALRTDDSGDRFEVRLTPLPAADGPAEDTSRYQGSRSAA
ncbi:sensor histidine kinase [Ideonella sp.]|uniref:sensor histidine kinase n=1 Tax=Ideonella sp. TaxID=1929293 RepID=UPI0035B3C853